MNKSFIEYFAKKGYLLFCPKTHNFGGFHESLLWALKIKKYNKKKIIINLPLISVHSHYRTLIKRSYGKKIIYNYFTKLSFPEKFLSVLVSLFGNILIFFCKIKLLALFNLISGKKISKLEFPFLGFGLRNMNELNDYNQLEIEGILKTRVSISMRQEIASTKGKLVSFCVKDNNYSAHKNISNFATANVNHYKKAINYLIENGYKVSRVGEDTMNNFDFNHINFEDNCKSKNHFELLHERIEKSDFYFGTGASHSVIPDLYNKKKLLTNNIDFIQNSISSSYENMAIFKKIFCLKKKKFLSLEEIFFDKKLFFLNIDNLIKDKEIILIENSPDEILSATKNFIHNAVKNEKISDLMIKYEVLRENAIKYHKKKNIKNFYIPLYESSKITIPDNYLATYLVDSKDLHETSKKFCKEFNL